MKKLFAILAIFLTSGIISYACVTPVVQTFTANVNLPDLSLVANTTISHLSGSGAVNPGNNITNLVASFDITGGWGYGVKITWTEQSGWSAPSGKNTTNPPTSSTGTGDVNVTLGTTDGKKNINYTIASVTVPAGCASGAWTKTIQCSVEYQSGY